MPSWLRNQLLRAFQEKDRRSIVMLNRIFYKYRNNQTLMSQQS
nr:cortex morphogenetic protein CmpA [Collibacillus ludicampi]